MENRQSRRSKEHSRGGWVLKTPLLVLGVVVVGVPLFWSLLPKTLWQTAQERPLTARVVRGEFINEVTERGDVESASNVEVRCDVETQGSGVMIIRIVPEGTYVQPGDFLAELDSSALRDQLVQQQIKVANERALLIQAQRTLDTALIARQEYVEGQYRQQRLEIEIQNFVSQENRRRAEDYLKYSQSLAQKGYITQAQLEADQFALEKSIKELESARTQLEVLERFTKPKMLKQLDADVETARAKLEAQQHSSELEEQQLKKIEDQIKKCIITAPAAGQVVYANQVGVRGQTDVIIQEGVRIRQYQTVVRLPDPKRMQAKTKVNESKIGLIRTGQPAKVRIDALSGKEFDAEVTDVSEYPLPTSFFNSDVKEYEVLVKINHPTEELRAGLTAQVTILCQRESNVLMVPVQSVFEHVGEFYAITMGEDSTLRPVKVEIGPSNDRFIVIRKGLEENQEVVLNAAGYREKVGLPEKKITPPKNWTDSQGQQTLAGGEASARAARAAGQVAASAAQGRQAPGNPEVAALPRGPAMGAAGAGVGLGPSQATGEFNPAMVVDRMFERMDSNQDGKLDPSEIPEDRRDMMLANDANGDGALDRQEMIAGMEKMRAVGGGPGGFGAPRAEAGRSPQAEGGSRL